eukprot:Rhum_TRINITY_DN2425_c0_g1::Rhum_TRINITY_DN2425_c0_g1_i1::g.7209::m.7209/K06013/STE24; STE24 endopeptidase
MSMFSGISTFVLGDAGVLKHATTTFTLARFPGIFTERASYLEGLLLLAGGLGAFELYLELRQLRKDGETEIPAEALELGILKADEDAEKFKEIQAYSRDKRHVEIASQAYGIVQEVLDKVVVSPMLYFALRPGTLIGAGSALKAVCDRNPSWLSYELVYFLAYSQIKDLVYLPVSVAFSAYSKFVVEEKHGFNRMDARTFVTDLVKGQAVGLLIGTSVTTAFYTILKRMGKDSFLYLWGFVQALQFAMMWIYPNYIQPLYNDFTELDKDSDVYEGVKKLADRVDYPLYKVFTMDASKRSAHSNAYLFGFWKWKRIVLFDTLMKQPTEEVLAIVSHELGHWKMGHTATNLCCVSALIASFFASANVLLFAEDQTIMRDIFASFGFADAYGSDLLLKFTLASTVMQGPISLGFQRLLTVMSRVFEFQADAFAVELGYGTELASGLKTLHVENKSSLTDDWLWAWWHRSHPTTVERLAALKRRAKKED